RVTTPRSILPITRSSASTEASITRWSRARIVVLPGQYSNHAGREASQAPARTSVDRHASARRTTPTSSDPSATCTAAYTTAPPRPGGRAQPAGGRRRDPGREEQHGRHDGGGEQDPAPARAGAGHGRAPEPPPQEPGEHDRVRRRRARGRQRQPTVTERKGER